MDGITVNIIIWITLFSFLAFSIYLFFKSEKDLAAAKELAEIVALLFVGVYFVYQISGGNDITSLSLELEPERKSYNDTLDLILLNLKLSNGDKGALNIHQVQARITPYLAPESSQEVDFHGYIRYKLSKDSFSIDKKWDKDKDNAYRLATQESTNLSAVEKVGKYKIYKIEVVVVGERLRFGLPSKGLWQISAFSVPKDSIN